MPTRVYRISVLLGVRLAEGPVGTKLALFWLLWALLSGRFLRSRGAVCPALAALGRPADAVRRSRAALTSGRWTVQALLQAWHTSVQPEGRWYAHADAGVQPVVGAVVGCFRPQRSGGGGKPYHSGANKAWLAIGLAVVAASGALGNVRWPRLRLLWRTDPAHGRDAERPRRAITQAGARWPPDEGLGGDAGGGGAYGCRDIFLQSPSQQAHCGKRRPSRGRCPRGDRGLGVGRGGSPPQANRLRPPKAA